MLNIHAQLFDFFATQCCQAIDFLAGCAATALRVFFQNGEHAHNVPTLLTFAAGFHAIPFLMAGTVTDLLSLQLGTAFDQCFQDEQFGQ